MRLLKNAKKTHSEISQNPNYQFSKRFALSIYPLDAIYTFIPKNGCSSLRYSTAVANGFLSNIDDVDWIHQNNGTFVATQQEISRAKYTFIVLRCPFQRLTSCFLNKFVSGDYVLKDKDGKPFDLNFAQFVNLVASQKREEMNMHWRNQSDFLHYALYDDYFCLENFDVAIKKLKDIGFDVFDTRAALKHDRNSISQRHGDYSSIPISVLKEMKNEGNLPDDKSLYTSATYSIVKNIYKDDIELYTEQIGEQNILKL